MEDFENTLFDDLEEEIEDEGQSGVVDQTSGDVTDEGTEGEPAGEAEDLDVDGPAPHPQSWAENQAAAAARKQAEAQARKAEEENARLSADLNILRSALKGYGYDGSAQDIADAITATRTGQTAEDVRSTREAEERAFDERINNHPAVVQARRIADMLVQQRNQDMFNAELRNIQKINPQIRSIADLRNLGEQQEVFDALVKGGMHIDKAYQVVAGKQARVSKPDNRSHMSQVNGGVGGGGTVLSAEEIAMCKEMGLTSKEINAWCKNHK